MIKPPKLDPGDGVRIVAPASPVRRELFNAGVQALEMLGLRAIYENPFEKWRYLAGKDEHRRRELENALNDAEVKAIFFARGGYGSLRLLLQEFVAPRIPKIIHGCSDITSLHLYAQQTFDWVVFHGPMPSGDFARGQVHVESLRRAMMQREPYALEPENIQVLRTGDAEGILKGGCLTLLEAAVGTSWEPDWRDSILFIEDVATKPYQIDRMLTHMKIVGKFNHVKAFIFGEMNDCVQVENQGYTLQEVILDLLGDFDVPILFNFPSGHVSGLNWTLPLGVRARVSTTPAFRLEILEGAVQ